MKITRDNIKNQKIIGFIKLKDIDMYFSNVETGEKTPIEKGPLEYSVVDVYTHNNMKFYITNEWNYSYNEPQIIPCMFVEEFFNHKKFNELISSKSIIG